MTAPEPQRAAPDHDQVDSGIGRLAPTLRTVATAGGAKRTLRLDDVDDVIGIAAELRAEEEEQLTLDDLRDIGVQLGIEERYVERAWEALKQRRQSQHAADVRRVALRQQRLVVLAIGAATLGIGIGGGGWNVQGGLNERHAAVERARAQVQNVVERQAKTEAQYRSAPPSLDRDAELSGADNRVRIERRRYDQAVSEYNAYARGPFASAWGRLFGFPARAPMSDEVEAW